MDLWRQLAQLMCRQGISPKSLDSSARIAGQWLNSPSECWVKTPKIATNRSLSGMAQVALEGMLLAEEEMLMCVCRRRPSSDLKRC
jgi:hypothetical protein